MQIVDISINYRNNDYQQLQEEIRHMFNISNIVIAKSMTDDAETLIEVGKAAAKELDAYLRNDMTLGISWGKTRKGDSKIPEKSCILEYAHSGN